MLVAAGFRPDSASGRLLAAASDGRLLALWTVATRAEAVGIVGRIPPLRALDLDAAFPEAGRVDAALDLGPFADADGTVDQTLAAIAVHMGALLVTADRRLRDAAVAGGAAALSPADAARLVL